MPSLSGNLQAGGEPETSEVLLIRRRDGDARLLSKAENCANRLTGLQDFRQHEESCSVVGQVRSAAGAQMQSMVFDLT